MGNARRDPQRIENNNRHLCKQAKVVTATADFNLIPQFYICNLTAKINTLFV
jgi:hypothetical protein